MIFIGNINVDPSEVTKIKRVKPNSFIKKFLNKVTLGKIKDIIEEENFTAFSILQQFHTVLTDLGIDNIIRLSHNKNDYYLDVNGDENDLERALKEYKSDLQFENSKYFKTLSLVLEHDLDSFHFYIEIRINKSHKLGDYPIELKINGLLNQFYIPNSNKNDLIKKLEGTFVSPDAYDHFIESKMVEFENFVDVISRKIKSNISVDHLKQKIEKAIILPDSIKNHPNDIKIGSYSNPPAFHGYFQAQERIWYSFIWPELCSDYDIHVNNTTILSEKGKEVGKLEEQGIDSGDSDLFNLSNYAIDDQEDKIIDDEEWL